MLDILTTLFKRHKGAMFRVPGAITADSRILAVAAPCLADLVFHAPLLGAIRRRWPEAPIDVLVPEDLATLVVPSGLAREVIVYAPKQLAAWRPAYASLLRELGKTGYDVALMMSLSPHPLLEAAALASGAVLRAGCGHRDAYPQLNLELRPAEPVRGYYGDLPRHLAPYLGIEAEEIVPGWPIAPERLRQAAQLVHFHKPNKDELLVGVDPAVGKSGHGLAVESLQALVRAVTGQIQCCLLPLSGPGDPERVQRFESALSGVPPGLARDTVLDTILLLCQCDLFLAGNTDLFHVAVAHGVPTIGLFSPEDDERWRPGDQTSARVLTVNFGEKMDVAKVLEAVGVATGGRGAKTHIAARAQAAVPTTWNEPTSAPPGEA
jgi:ADP-heptose:LPS heptosyltransferase